MTSTVGQRPEVSSPPAWGPMEIVHVQRPNIQQEIGGRSSHKAGRRIRLSLLVGEVAVGSFMEREFGDLPAYGVVGDALRLAGAWVASGVGHLSVSAISTPIRTLTGDGQRPAVKREVSRWRDEHQQLFRRDPADAKRGASHLGAHQQIL